MTLTNEDLLTIRSVLMGQAVTHERQTAALYAIETAMEERGITPPPPFVVRPPPVPEQ